MTRDPHAALQTEIVASARSSDVQALIARLRWSKSDEGYSIHVAPSTYTTAGFQSTDLLAYMGFKRSQCAFVDRRECYVRWGSPEIDLQRLVSKFGETLERIRTGEKHLNACGFILPQPEGWGYFFDKPSGTERGYLSAHQPEGHVAQKSELMKKSNDGIFEYRLSWIEDPARKGWSIHYAPIHRPLSPEMEVLLTFLALSPFNECPYFDFDSCYYRFIPFRSTPDRFFDSNAEHVHQSFDAHATNFSPALKAILDAQSIISTFGLNLLPLESIAPTSPTTKRREPKEISVSGRLPERFDVAVSFASPERQLAEALAQLVRNAGFEVFYDSFYPEQLWGKDLAAFFDEIFRKKARYCVMFISKAYAERVWTNYERRSAQARALEEKGQEYILPVVVEHTELPGLPPTIGHLSVKDYSIEEIADLLVKKLRS